MTRTTVLWPLFALQAICSTYFLMDIAMDFLWPLSSLRIAESDLLEGLVTVALFGGLIFTANELRLVLRRQSKLEDQIGVASGAFSEVLAARFNAWFLTEAERQVAMLALKGFSIAEIADLRETKQGTIKAQCASVYRKANVSGRLQLLSVFIEDLLADNLVAADHSFENRNLI